MKKQEAKYKKLAIVVDDIEKEIHADAREARARQCFNAISKQERPDIAVNLILQALDEWYKKGLTHGSHGIRGYNMKYPPILDACCGGRQFWFDKENSNVLFADCRVMPPKTVGSGKNARTRKCLPDTVHDFRDMPYPNESFQMVVFDPPHLFLGANSFMAQSYGRLKKNTWCDDLTRGFAECFRVLKPGGTLIFKWNECDILLSEILKCTPHKPLFGHPSGKAQKTHWVAFWKSI